MEVLPGFVGDSDPEGSWRLARQAQTQIDKQELEGELEAKGHGFSAGWLQGVLSRGITSRPEIADPKRAGLVARVEAGSMIFRWYVKQLFADGRPPKSRVITIGEFTPIAYPGKMKLALMQGTRDQGITHVCRGENRGPLNAGQARPLARRARGLNLRDDVLLMEPTTALWIGGFAVAMYLAWKYERRKDEKRNLQFDLRYPEWDNAPPEDGDTFSARTFVDFEQMVLVNEMSDYAFHHTRVFQLRRLDGPRWEIREDEASRERSRAHLTQQKERGWSSAEEKLAELADFDWKPCGYSDEIEPKYQLFLRHRDPTAATFRGGMVERAVENDFVEGAARPLHRTGK